MYHFRFKLKPHDVGGMTPLPPFLYAFIGGNWSRQTDGDPVIDYFTFDAITIDKQDIQAVWPEAMDIEKLSDEPVDEKPMGPVWITPTYHLTTGPLHVRFFVVGNDTAPTQSPLPSHVMHTDRCVGGFDVWMGYFESIDQLLELFPGAFCIRVL